MTKQQIVYEQNNHIVPCELGQCPLCHEREASPSCRVVAMPELVGTVVDTGETICICLDCYRYEMEPSRFQNLGYRQNLIEDRDNE